MTGTWSDFLAQRGARLEGTALAFGPPAEDAKLSVQGAALVPLTHLGLIRARGEEAANFFHNLFSNDVKNQAPDQARWNSFNSPKGRMLASFLVWRQGDDYLMALSADLQPSLLKKLAMYVLRAKVKLDDPAQDQILLGVAGPTAASVLESVGLAPLPEVMEVAAQADAQVIRMTEQAFVLATSPAAAPALFDRLAGAGARPAGTAAWQAASVAAGLPLVTQPTQEEFVAQMLNFELIGGVSFNKGCYPGQEIVARTHYLGKLKKRMYRLHLADGPAPAPGQDLYAPDFADQSAGKLVNVAPSPQGGFEALAVLQTSSAEAGEVHLGAPDGPRLAFLPLPYALP
ncbi:MAG: folate-binding protein [Rhodocyclaceae bacterium]|jgi:folate-binding protein YgfZ|nr:folate-binding protein [Rhodocyclaceae bacterium]